VCTTGTRERVELHLPAVVRLPYTRRDPPLTLEAVTRRIERSLGALQAVSRYLLDTLRDCPAVLGFELDRFEDQKVERALEEINRFAHLTTLTVYHTLASGDCQEPHASDASTRP